MKKIVKTACLASVALMASVATQAQESVEASVGADLVSGYVWRGQDLGNAAIQPSLSLSWNGLSLSAWGSVGLVTEEDKEFDLTLGYTFGGFSVSVTDYWFNSNPKYFDYEAHTTSHVFEAQVGYDFGVVNVNWFTNFAGADGVNKDGDRAYSSYIQVGIPFKLGGLEWEAEVGATPWATDFYAEADGFAVCDVAVQATKELKLSQTFSLPVFAKAAWNPATEGAHFVVGLSF